MDVTAKTGLFTSVALRKESVDRNNLRVVDGSKSSIVALRKESVDRNPPMCFIKQMPLTVALRKESVDRNKYVVQCRKVMNVSLSARRAWIEIQDT